MKPDFIGRPKDNSAVPHPFSSIPTDTGFGAGTVVLARKGEMLIEEVTPGDHLITRDAGMAMVMQIASVTLSSRAIFFAAGSLGDTRPGQDLILPASQPVLIRDWRAQAMFGVDHAMVRADALIDNEFVRDLGLREMMLHQLEFGAPRVVYAGGLELASTWVNTLALRNAA
ncbi:Hint domain-containing protein [Arenibacterium sp. CAU 1754]